MPMAGGSDTPATADASRLCLSLSVVALLVLWAPVWWYTTCSSHRPIWGVLPLQREIQLGILDPLPLALPCNLHVVFLDAPPGSAEGDACPQETSHGSTPHSHTCPALGFSNRKWLQGLAHAGLGGLCGDEADSPGVLEESGDVAGGKTTHTWGYARRGVVSVHVAATGNPNAAQPRDGSLDSLLDTLARVHAEHSAGQILSLPGAVSSAEVQKLESAVHSVLESRARPGSYWVLVLPGPAGTDGDPQSSQPTMRVLTGAQRYSWLVWSPRLLLNTQGNAAEELTRSAGRVALASLARGCQCTGEAGVYPSTLGGDPGSTSAKDAVPASVEKGKGPPPSLQLRVILLYPAPAGAQSPLSWDAKAAEADMRGMVNAVFEEPPALDIQVEAQAYGPGELQCSVPSGQQNQDKGAGDTGPLSLGFHRAVCFMASAQSAPATPYSVEDFGAATSHPSQAPQRPFLLVVPPPHHLCSSSLSPKGPFLDSSAYLRAHMLASPVYRGRTFSCPGGISGAVWQPSLSTPSGSLPTGTPPRNCCLGSASDVLSAPARLAGDSKDAPDVTPAGAHREGVSTGEVSETNGMTCCPSADVEAGAALVSHVRGLLGVQQEWASSLGLEEQGREVQVQVLHGEGGSRVAQWEGDVALREELNALQQRIRDRLGLLVELLDSFPNMPLSREVQQLVRESLQRVREVKSVLAAALVGPQGERVPESMVLRGLEDALGLASEAASHPSLFLTSYNPWEHYLAIYSPLLLPLFLHGVVSLVKELRLWREAHKGKVA